MIKTILSPKEIFSIIESVMPVTRLFIKIRRGEWDPDELGEIATRLDRAITDKKKNQSSDDYDREYRGVMGIIGVSFFSKDKFGYRWRCAEHLALERLVGRLLAALEHPTESDAQDDQI